MSTPKARVPNTVLLTAALAVAGCSTPSREDFQRMESSVAELRGSRGGRRGTQLLERDHGGFGARLRKPVQPGLPERIERLDQLYLEILPR